MKFKQTSACAQPAGREADQLLGAAFALVDQLGAADNLSPIGAIAASLRLPKVDTLRELQTFLEAYDRNILRPLELPAVVKAYGYATSGQARELISLDQQMGSMSHLAIFAHASQRIGRSQLERMRPLRDQRVVQRYLAAVESGDAHGWHPLVYGITIAVYSLPPRQGLVHFGQETLAGLAIAAARSRSFSQEACDTILKPLFATLPQAIEQALIPGPAVR